ncbi:MAG: hypothetical protein PVJ86_01415 [Phycisphaerales bacterium]|jgi:hypothetical protein
MDEIKQGVVESATTSKPDVPDFFPFHLRKPVRFNHGGAGVEVDKIEIHAPSVGMLIKYFGLKQMVSSAIVKALRIQQAAADLSFSEQALLEEKKIEQEKKEFSPIDAARDARYVIMLSELNLELAIERFGSLAIGDPESRRDGCIQINGQNLNFLQWNDIREDDKMDIFFQFVGVFMLPSAFSPDEI